MTVERGRRVVTGFWAEFWEFIKRGNVVDLAVAVVIGSAFARIVDSLVTDIITPAIVSPALAAANVDSIQDWTVGNGIKVGLFLAAVLNFIIIALAVFAAIRLYETFRHRVLRTEDAEAAPDPVLESQEKLTGAIERLTTVVERQTS
jgi:large conductance mechanosensitive channel